MLGMPFCHNYSSPAFPDTNLTLAVTQWVAVMTMFSYCVHSMCTDGTILAPDGLPCK